MSFVLIAQCYVKCLYPIHKCFDFKMKYIVVLLKISYDHICKEVLLFLQKKYLYKRVMHFFHIVLLILRTLSDVYRRVWPPLPIGAHVFLGNSLFAAHKCTRGSPDSGYFDLL